MWDTLLNSSCKPIGSNSFGPTVRVVPAGLKHLFQWFPRLTTLVPLLHYLIGHTFLPVCGVKHPSHTEVKGFLWDAQSPRSWARFFTLHRNPWTCTCHPSNTGRRNLHWGCLELGCFGRCFNSCFLEVMSWGLDHLFQTWDITIAIVAINDLISCLSMLGARIPSKPNHLNELAHVEKTMVNKYTQLS